jgi:hypothetical protein
MSMTPKFESPEHAELMPRRLEQLGLDVDYLRVCRAATYQELERVCAACQGWRQCARDLAAGDVQAGMGTYCGNTPVIDELVADRPPGAPQR